MTKFLQPILTNSRWPPRLIQISKRDNSNNTVRFANIDLQMGVVVADSHAIFIFFI